MLSDKRGTMSHWKLPGGGVSPLRHGGECSPPRWCVAWLDASDDFDHLFPPFDPSHTTRNVSGYAARRTKGTCEWWLSSGILQCNNIPTVVQANCGLQRGCDFGFVVPAVANAQRNLMKIPLLRSEPGKS